MKFCMKVLPCMSEFQVLSFTLTEVYTGILPEYIKFLGGGEGKAKISQFWSDLHQKVNKNYSSLFFISATEPKQIRGGSFFQQGQTLPNIEINQMHIY